MAGFRVNFSVPELSNVINQIGAYNGRTARKIEEAVSRATKNVSKGMRQRVPVDTGDLKRSIRSRFDARTITGFVTAKQYYAHFVEFGAKANPSKNIPQRAAHPFARPAFEQEKPNLIRDIEQAVRP